MVDPARVVAEIQRVLKPGGLVYAETPFMQQVHEGAYDFTRFTELGHRWLWRRFAPVARGALGGPGLSLLVVALFPARAAAQPARRGSRQPAVRGLLALADRWMTPAIPSTGPAVPFSSDASATRRWHHRAGGRVSRRAAARGGGSARTSSTDSLRDQWLRPRRRGARPPDAARGRFFAGHDLRILAFCRGRARWPSASPERSARRTSTMVSKRATLTRGQLPGRARARGANMAGGAPRWSCSPSSRPTSSAASSPALSPSRCVSFEHISRYRARRPRVGRPGTCSGPCRSAWTKCGPTAGDAPRNQRYFIPRRRGQQIVTVFRADSTTPYKTG